MDKSTLQERQKSADEIRAEMLRLAGMRVARAIDAQRGFADLLRIAVREGGESIDAASIAEMIDCLADRFEESFSPFRGFALSGMGDGH